MESRFLYILRRRWKLVWYLGKLQKTRQCACGRAPGPQMLAHREENELLSKAMVSSVSLGMYLVYIRPKSFPGGSDDKESACNAGDPGLNPGSGRSPGEGNGNPLQYSCLENPMDRGAWRATVSGVVESQTLLSTHSTESE